MRPVVAALSASLALAVAGPAAAVTITLGAIDSGPVNVTGSYAPGYKLFNFNDGSSPFTGGGTEIGTVTDQYVEPTGDTTRYFSAGPSTSTPASLTFSGVNQVSFYWGSIDLYNSITFDGLGLTYQGGTFGGTDTPGYRPSREVTFTFTASEAAALKGITLRSNTNAFELDDLIFGSAAPEPGTWAMMIVGFGAVGTMLRARARSSRVRVTA